MWVDPVVVLPLEAASKYRGKHPESSNIHGTNGMMVQLPGRPDEFLGIAHFHRPKGRSSSNYARHGHHYTHAFYTLVKSGGENGGGRGTYRLGQLSDEFLFSSPSLVLNADIIQFASGLDIVPLSNGEHKVVISYGINDCEGAVTTIDMIDVLIMLFDIGEGKEVADLMMRPLPDANHAAGS